MRKSLAVGMLLLLGASGSALADKGGDGDGGSYPDFRNYFRLDCRYHSDEHHGIPPLDHQPGDFDHHGSDGRHDEPEFCYASAVYFLDSMGVFHHVHLGVGCDNTTLYNDDGFITVETTLDRLSPPNSAVPGVEIFPQGQLGIEGTYTSMLDIPEGRFQGLCYIKRISWP